MNALFAQTWPWEQAPAALDAICREAGLFAKGQELPAPPANLGEQRIYWLEEALRQVGIEFEPVETSFPEVRSLLVGCAPAVLNLNRNGESGLLCVLKNKRRKVCVLGPNLQRHWFSLDQVEEAFCHPHQQQREPLLETLLDSATLHGRRRARARRAILKEWLGSVAVPGCWILRPTPAASFWHQLLRARVPTQTLTLIALQGVQSLVFVLSWWIIGRGALQGELRPGWLVAWGLAIATLIPLQVLIAWIEARLSVRAGGLLKRRLLQGAMNLSPDEVRHHGSGIQLSKVLESQAVEQLALTGGFLAIAAWIDLGLATFVLSSASSQHALLLVVWLLPTLWWAQRAYRTRSRWTRSRMTMTHELIENMVGHRTRLAQLPADRWHQEEDRSLERTMRDAGHMDRAAIAFRLLVPHGFTLLALVSMIPLLRGSPDLAQVAVTVGGILFAVQALSRLTSTTSQLSGAAISWQQVAGLFRAAARTESADPGAVTTVAPATAPSTPKILEIREASYRHAGRHQPVLREISATVNEGDRILLEGESGGGKSTLASLLVGLRPLSSGLLLLRGMDRQTVGPQNWRRRVVGVPQFHDNHVMSGTLAFNLLLGRNWPPTPQDLHEAETVCQELGLGPLLDRMPARLNQWVGETGWQLSHGERSRLFLARGLLQVPEVLVLDETFAALDPSNLVRAMQSVLDRTKALVVIAHP